MVGQERNVNRNRNVAERTTHLRERSKHNRETVVETAGRTQSHQPRTWPAGLPTRKPPWKHTFTIRLSNPSPRSLSKGNEHRLVEKSVCACLAQFYSQRQNPESADRSFHGIRAPQAMVHPHNGYKSAMKRNKHDHVRG